MHGNLFEWCEDTFVESFYSRPEARQPDPVCKTEYKTARRERVARGGNWDTPAPMCRPARRFSFPPGDKGNYVGFRPVFPVDE